MNQASVNERGRPGKLDGRGRRPDGLMVGAVLLNLTGSGAGYVVLRRWRRWGAYLALTFSFLGAAVLVDAPGSRALWVTIMTLWIVASALDAARSEAVTRPGQTPRAWAPAAGAVLVLVVEVGLVSSYRAAGQDAMGAGLAAEARGDCRSALDSYRQVTTVYELASSDDARTAQRKSAGCEQVLDAAQARAAGDLKRAIALYDGLLSERPESVLVAHLRRWRIEAYTEWGSRLRGLSDHERAIEVYRQLETASGDATSAKGLVADTYLEWGDHLRFKRTPAGYNKAIDVYRRLEQSGDAVRARGRLADTYLELGDSLRTASEYKGAVTQYGIVLTQFSDLAAPAGVARSRLIGIGEAAQAPIANRTPCAALPILDALATAVQPFASQASTLTPGAMLSCGEQSYREGRILEAITQFRTLRERFPKSDLAARAEIALIDAEVAAVQRGTSSPLPAPQRTGPAAGRSVVLIIRNDSPRPIEVLVSGPSSKRIALGACGNCYEVGFAPVACPGKGPQVEIALDPGEYKAVAKVTDGTKVTPFSGTWSMSGGSKYSHCLYIETRRF